MIKDKRIQMICLPKKSPAASSEVKDFIVTNPKADIGSINKTSIQSILLIAFSAISKFNYCNFTEKKSYIGIISLLATVPEKGSGQVKFISVVWSGLSWSK